MRKLESCGQQLRPPPLQDELRPKFLEPYFRGEAKARSIEIARALLHVVLGPTGAE
jgi:hypothetical protein